MMSGIRNAYLNILKSIENMDTTCPNCKEQPKDKKGCVRTIIYNPETKAMHDNYAWDCVCGTTYQTLSAPLPHLQFMADEITNKG